MAKVTFILMFIFLFEAVEAQTNFSIKYDNQTGAVERIGNKTDKYQMNFVYEPNENSNAQYKSNRWGLGGCIMVNDGNEVKFQWQSPSSIRVKQNTCRILYGSDQLEVEVIRKEVASGRFEENYKITNKKSTPAQINNLYIYVPFNDEFPNAKTCVTNRCNTHIWAGGDASYINATRMGGEAPHLGMVITQGFIGGYSISGKTNSNERGVISLNFGSISLNAGSSYTISWQLFWNKDWDDFSNQAKELGWIKGSANYYTLEAGEKAIVNFEGKGIGKACCSINGKLVATTYQNNKISLTTDTLSIGEHTINFQWKNKKTTWVKLLVTSPFKKLLKKRLDFIVNHQQVKDTSSVKFGAFMVYDNETESIVNVSDDSRLVDWDEGAERNGMGVIMAQYARINKDTIYIAAARKYASYVRNRLQTLDYKTYSNVQHTSRHRGYNYIFAANVFLEMYKTTREEKYLSNAYNTILKFYAEFKDFYAIGIPCKALIEALTEAGRKEEMAIALTLFRKQADLYLHNGILVPEHEVNYEQTIIAPSVALLTEFFLVTKEKKYLDAAKQQMPALESFNGFQPDYHQHNIAIRHWDGYWFGKRKMWGDVFPHYWSAFSGYAFWMYAQATDDKKYAEKARDIVRNNLCQFFEDGRASCAYIFPDSVNGIKGKFFDPFANDQDNALIYFFDIMVNTQ